MYILSKYKDYYDYLTGIYGEDPLLVLDRRDYQQPDWQFPSTNQWRESEIRIYNLWIGDYNIEFIRYGYEFYYGENIFGIPIIKQVEHPQRDLFGKYEKINKENTLAYRSIDTPEYRRYGTNYILKNPVKIDRPQYLPDNIVIALGNFDRENVYTDVYYPILQDIKLNKFISAEQVYQMIVEYISKQNTLREIHIDNRTNIQKIEGKGFDKITSFRNIK